MNRFKKILILIISAFSLMVISPANGAEYITDYTTGKVTNYDKGKTISILDHEGSEKTYKITEESELPEGLANGVIVEVKASGFWAVSIEILSK